MRITLLGVLGCLAAAALLIYAGYELHGVIVAKQFRANPEPPVNP